MGEIQALSPGFGIRGMCRMAGIKPAELKFGERGVAKTPCGRGIILGVCQGMSSCNFDHDYVCTNAEAQAAVKQLGIVPKKLKEEAESRKRKRS